MTADETTKYLKMVSELEASVHCQEQMIETAKREMDNKKYQPKLESLPAPKKSTFRKPESPYGKNGAIITEDSVARKERTKKALSYFLLGAAAFFIIFGLILGGSKGLVGMLAFAISIVGAYFFSMRDFQKTIDEERQQLRKYQEEVQKYNERVEAEEEDFARRIEEYEAKQQAAQRVFEESTERNEQRRALVESKIVKMSRLLAETRVTLKNLYSLDYIFPKYRNLVAMSTIYEYYASGRCSELTGADGAYNLYEMELRQNIIIGQLDQIVDRLDQIKQNQYMLYTELKETNSVLQNISRDVSSIMVSTKNVEESTYLTSQYAKITAQNTEAIKYISLARG